MVKSPLGSKNHVSDGGVTAPVDSPVLDWERERERELRKVGNSIFMCGPVLLSRRAWSAETLSSWLDSDGGPSPSELLEYPLPLQFSSSPGARGYACRSFS